MVEEFIKEENVDLTWLEEEIKGLNNFEGGRLPILKFPENEFVEFDIDFSKPFNMYQDMMNKTTKKIVPILYNGNRMVWFLNVSNPIYSKVILAGKNGQKHFKILRTGQMKNTKYILVK